jgi:pyruvate-ferredoxin/flavodoxin oxidoreductase
MSRKFESIDGNTAATYIAYAFSDVAAIYPITPSSNMGEIADEMSAKGVLNLFGQRVKVSEMQSEAGAAGAVHGVLSQGGLATTFTASQGLLLMIPNMFKIAGELSPTVFHVSARTVATHALSIFGDHSDVMATRGTGFGLMAAASPQEVHDLAIVSHIATYKTKVPMVNFFDGFRTSHEIQKIEIISYDELEKLAPWKDVENFRKRGMNPEHPHLRGTAQNPDIFFQAREAANPYYNAAPLIIADVMRTVSEVLGRSYNLFDYVGDPEPDRVVVLMASAADVAQEAVDYLREVEGEKVGIVKVRLYRPWSAKHILDAIPRSAKRITTLDRTKEPGSIGDPLYMDVATTFKEAGREADIYGGRYGLSSKDFTPTMVKAVFDNMKQHTPKNHFTVGILDDVTYTSLPLLEGIDTTPKGTVRCKFWGFGSDGTVSANKAAIKIIGDQTEKYTQGYFAYDAKKSGGVTISHLRFSDSPIRGHYLVNVADYVACHNPSYMGRYEMVNDLKKGGTFVINCPWTEEDFDRMFPGSVKRFIAQNKIKVYSIDAVKMAREVGLGGRINMIMQTVFFKLAEVIPFDDAVKSLKKGIEKQYGHRGREIVEMNFRAVDMAADGLFEVKVPDRWADAELEPDAIFDEPAWVTNVMRVMNAMMGDKLPVSAFAAPLDGEYVITGPDGSFPLETTKYEKRGIADKVPRWNPETCNMDSVCAFVCPHSVIRPILVNEDEKSKAPKSFITMPTKGRALQGLDYRLQISVMDCTGCYNCIDACPVNKDAEKADALEWSTLEREMETEIDNWAFATTVSEKSGLMKKTVVTGSQMVKPLFEFHGACAGCGETPYYKLLTQLFGDRLLIANATGCSSIYGGSAPAIPFTTNEQGHGPAWANSLFEDNAEYAFGMKLSHDQRRHRIANDARKAIESGISDDLKNAMGEWLDGFDDGEKSREAGDKMAEILKKEAKGNRLLEDIYKDRDMFTKKSIWAIGGDGWAYDIGFGGLDHVMAMNEDVNILVLDTEVYSNTGGQSSKASPTGAVAKFAYSGKKTAKKDLGAIIMTYGYVYVATVSMGANRNHLIKVFDEAEKYPGPSLIIAYSPCIAHGIKDTGMKSTQYEMELAVRTGYWPLYRYNPLLKLEGKNPFTLDSKDPDMDLDDLLLRENRYASLHESFPDEAKMLSELLKQQYVERWEYYKRMAEKKAEPVTADK